MKNVRFGTRGRMSNSLIAALAAGCLLLIGLVMFLPGGRDRSAPTSVVETGERVAQQAPREEPRGDASPRAGSAAPRQERAAAPSSTGRAFSVRVFGTITNGDSGDPLSSAVVQIYSMAGAEQGNPPREESTSGSDGSFAFTVDRASFQGGSLILQASAEGFAPARRQVMLVPGRSQAEVSLTLYPAAPLRGAVVDRAGNPVPRARVGILVGENHPASPMQDPYTAFPVIEADDAGLFEFEAVPQARLVRVHATHENFIPGFAEATAPAEEQTTVVLRQGEARVRGRVLDAQGNGLAGAAVSTVFRPTGPGWRPTPPFPDMDTQFTRSDEEGYFEFTAVRAGWQTLVATMDAPALQSTGNSTLLATGEEKVVTLQFDPALVVSGIVVDAESEEPVAGVQIARPTGLESAPRAGDVVDSITTGADGRFTVEMYSQVVAGTFRVPALYYKLPQQYQHDAENWQTHQVRFDRLQAGEEVRITARRTLLLQGFVYMDDEVTPAPGVGVDHRRQMQGGGQWAQNIQIMPDPDVSRAQVQTAANGSFQIRVTPGARGFLVARGELGYASLRYDVPEQGPLDPVEFTLVGFSSVSGRAIGPDGAPLPGATITMRQMAGQRGTAFTAVTGADGTYQLKEVYGTQAMLTAAPPEGELLVAPDMRIISMEPGQSLENENFEFARAELFEGVVVDEEGNPIEGVMLARRQGRGRGPNTATVESDAQGRFVFTDMTDEVRVFTLEARHPGYDDVDVEGLFVDDSPVTVQMRSRASVSLTAWEPGGRQVTSFEYQFVIERSSSSRDRRTNVEGKVVEQSAAVSEVLSPGTYRVHVYPISRTGERTGAYGFANFEIAEGAATEQVRVEIGESVTLRGRVVDDNDRGVEGVDVRLTVRDEATPQGNQWQRVEGGNRRSATTDSRGNFEFPFTIPGTLSLTARKEGYVQAEAVSLEVEAGTTPELVVVKIHTGASIRGVVTGQTGSPAGGMVVRLGANFRDPSETTGSDGAFEFTHVPPGSHRVVLLSSSGAEIMREDVTIGGVEQKELNFNLEGMVQVEGTLRRNGQRDRSRFFQLELIPLEGESAQRTSLIVGNGRYEQFLYPGTYSVEIAVSGSRGRSVTGEALVVENRPPTQQLDISLDLVNVGIVIVDVDGEGFQPGQFTFEHRPVNRRAEGTAGWSLSLQATRSLFYLDNQPTGEARGVFTTPQGARFVSDWTVLTDGGDNILTLIPEGL